MATTAMARQGDLALLDDPVAKELLASQRPARLAMGRLFSMSAAS